MAMKILIPYNFTKNDTRSIDFFINHYRGEPDADITLFHAYTPVPEIDIRNNPILEKLHRETLYLRQRQAEEKEVLGRTRNDLISKGFNGNRINIRFEPVAGDVAAHIIRLVKNEKFDRVVLNRNPGNIINYFSRSTSKQIIRKLGKGVQVHIVN